MKHLLRPVFALAMLAILASSSVMAESQEKMIIALKTTDFELTETDISALAIGESKTIETETGSVIDILRTTDGAEIYIDGELLDIDLDGAGLHKEHMVHKEHMIQKHVEVICEDGEECDQDVFILSDEDGATFELMEGHGDNIFIHEEIELSCSDDEEGTTCDERRVWTSDGEEHDLEELHEMHQQVKGHKVIVIKKQVVTED